MSLYEASFRVRHECPYRELSERHPDLTLREWSLSDCQVLEIAAPGTPADDLLAEIEAMGSILHRSIDETGLHVVTRACLCSLEKSIIDRFEAHNCLYQPPTIHRQGWEHYTVIAFDESDIRALHADLEADRDVDVVSKTAITDGKLPHSMLTPVDRLFESLTDRQLAALELAIENGYYEQPRGTSRRALAERTSVSRSTYEEHLRKAENKLLTSAGEVLRLVTATDGGDPLDVDGTTPTESAGQAG